MFILSLALTSAATLLWYCAAITAFATASPRWEAYASEAGRFIIGLWLITLVLLTFS